MILANSAADLATVLKLTHTLRGRTQETSDVLDRLQTGDVWIVPAGSDDVGVGKTTLAYLVATRGLNSGRFAWVAWIACGHAIRNVDQLVDLALPNHPAGLIVLDDVWFDVPMDWRSAAHYRLLVTTERRQPDGYALTGLSFEDAKALLTDLAGSRPEIEALVLAFGTLPVTLVNLASYLQDHSPDEALAGVHYLARMANPFQSPVVKETYSLSLTPPISDQMPAIELQTSVEDLMGVPGLVRITSPVMSPAGFTGAAAWAQAQDASLALAIMVNAHRWMMRQALQTDLRLYASTMNTSMLLLAQRLDNARLMLQAEILLALTNGEDCHYNLLALMRLRDQAAPFPALRALTEGMIGAVYWKQTDYQTAVEHFAWAANHFQRAADTFAEGRVLLTIARAQIAARQYGQAEKLLFHALPLLANTPSEFAARFELGGLNLLIGKGGAALYHFDHILKHGEAWLNAQPLDTNAIQSALRHVLNSPSLDVLQPLIPLADQALGTLTLRLLIRQAQELRQQLSQTPS